MNSEKLSNRLATVASFIPEGSRMADIGSDHAYLPCFAVLTGKAVFAIAGEVANGPFQSAKSEVELQRLSDKISVRKGDGLEVLSPGEVDTITIAGMGGALIANILDAGKEKLQNVKRLILQPNISAISIRNWLVENGWELTVEEILEEDGKIYEVLVAGPGEPLKPYVGKNMDASLLMGPFLMERQTEAFRKKWTYEAQTWKKIMKNLQSASETPENIQRREELNKKIMTVEEVLQHEKSERS